MTDKLWTRNFIRVCVANLLLFISLYILFPLLPSTMAGRLGIPVSRTGTLFLFLTLGMFLIGPFHAYLVDAYKRKHVYVFSCVCMLAATAGYGLVQDWTQLVLLCMAQGAAFGMATTAGITLAIDITGSALRSAGNVAFAWTSRLGMISGIALGAGLYGGNYELQTILYISIAIGLLGILFAMRVYIPFRAPMVTQLYSFDRFLLPRAWVPGLNLAAVAFLPGLMIPLVHPFLQNISWGYVGIPFFAMVGGGFLLSIIFAKCFPAKEKSFRTIIAGIGLLMLVMSFLPDSEPGWVVAIVTGLGLGLVVPEFLLIFVKLSRHCQRGTANTTHLLSWEVGISIGIAVACHWTTTQAFFVGKIIAPLALLFFILVTYPYFKRKKERD